MNSIHWLTAKHYSDCPTCGHEVKPGEKILYYPGFRMAICEECGKIRWQEIREREQKFEKEVVII